MPAKKIKLRKQTGTAAQSGIRLKQLEAGMPVRNPKTKAVSVLPAKKQQGQAVRDRIAQTRKLEKEL
jgi:hypothetical protein